MRPTSLAIVAIAASLLAGCAGSGGARSDTPADVRASIDRHAQDTLDKLYAEQPDARAKVEAAAGYAIFDLSAVNVVLLVGQQGKGVLVDNKSKERTYMKALRAGTGPGLGYQQLRQVFVFANESALGQFRLGGGAGGDVSAAATVGTANVQQSFNPFITTYQFTEKGFAVQANWGGTAYLVDSELNAGK
jgi:lipid-binding SYLF domain-containing protein